MNYFSFVHKMLKLGEILKKVLSYDDDNWAGISECFKSFYQKLRPYLENDQMLSQNVDEHLNEINEYVMLRMYREIFENNNVPSK